jgi:hypothetical protein
VSVEWRARTSRANIESTLDVGAAVTVTGAICADDVNVK